MGGSKPLHVEGHRCLPNNQPFNPTLIHPKNSPSMTIHSLIEMDNLVSRNSSVYLPIKLTLLQPPPLLNASSSSPWHDFTLQAKWLVLMGRYTAWTRRYRRTVVQDWEGGQGLSAFKIEWQYKSCHGWTFFDYFDIDKNAHYELSKLYVIRGGST